MREVELINHFFNIHVIIQYTRLHQNLNLVLAEFLLPVFQVFLKKVKYELGLFPLLRPFANLIYNLIEDFDIQFIVELHIVGILLGKLGNLCVVGGRYPIYDIVIG